MWLKYFDMNIYSLFIWYVIISQYGLSGLGLLEKPEIEEG